jgi:hypothetical protein
VSRASCRVIEFDLLFVRVTLVPKGLLRSCANERGTFRQTAVASRQYRTDSRLLWRRAMERALYIEPNLVSISPIQRASAGLPFVMRCAANNMPVMRFCGSISKAYTDSNRKRPSWSRLTPRFVGNRCEHNSLSEDSPSIVQITETRGFVVQNGNV